MDKAAEVLIIVQGLLRAAGIFAVVREMTLEEIAAVKSDQASADAEWQDALKRLRGE